MKTLSIAEARANLGKILRAAQRGEDVGIVCRGRVVALRPVEPSSAGYAHAEYGISLAEGSAAAKRVEHEVESDRKAGRIQPWTPRQARR